MANTNLKLVAPATEKRTVNHYAGPMLSFGRVST
jgi:hypothetical protein